MVNPTFRSITIDHLIGTTVFLDRPPAGSAEPLSVQVFHRAFRREDVAADLASGELHLADGTAHDDRPCLGFLWSSMMGKHRKILL